MIPGVYFGFGSVPSQSAAQQPPLFRGPLPPGRLFHPPANSSHGAAAAAQQPPLFRGPLPPGRLFHPPANSSHGAAAAAQHASGPMNMRPPFINNNYDFTLEAYIMNAEGIRLGGTVNWKNTTLNERISFLNMLSTRSNLNNIYISEFLRAIRWRIDRDNLSITTGSPVFVFSDQVEYNRAALCYMFPDEADGIQANWMTSPVNRRKEFLRYLLTKQNSIYGDAVRHILGNMGNNGSAASPNMNVVDDNASNAANLESALPRRSGPYRSPYASSSSSSSSSNANRASSRSSNANRASSRSSNAAAREAANLKSAQPRRSGPYNPPYASSSSSRSNANRASSRSSNANRASSRSSNAAAREAAAREADRAAAARARARMEDLARQEASQRASSSQAEEIASEYERVKAARNRLDAMRQFLNKHHPSVDWNTLFSVDQHGNLIDKGALKTALVQELHPDKHVSNPDKQAKYTELSKHAFNFRKMIKGGGTRRRARHTKNKTRSKRRTYRR